MLLVEFLLEFLLELLKFLPGLIDLLLHLACTLVGRVALKFLVQLLAGIFQFLTGLLDFIQGILGLLRGLLTARTCPEGHTFAMGVVQHTVFTIH